MKYFGTDGIRGHVNSKNINGDMFFKFGLAAGKYFTNLKKKKTNSNNSKRHEAFRLCIRASSCVGFSFSWYACLYTWSITH